MLSFAREVTGIYPEMGESKLMEEYVAPFHESLCSFRKARERSECCRAQGIEAEREGPGGERAEGSKACSLRCPEKKQTEL